MKYLSSDEVLNWWRMGRFLYSNCIVKGDFYYGENIAKKIFWRFYWLIPLEGK